MSDLDASGERVDVRGRPATHNELSHVARYSWAADRVSGRILDAACGTGYGSAILACSGEVTGIDYNEEAIAHARSCGIGTFVTGLLPGLPFRDGAFDAVVSFETIEHIEDDGKLVEEFRRVLRPAGTLILSTPNRERANAPDNPFHVREYSLSDLTRLVVDAGFREPGVFCQHPFRPTSALGNQVLRVVSRFPILCRPGRWWDKIAHGTELVEMWAGGDPTIWVLAATSAESG